MESTGQLSHVCRQDASVQVILCTAVSEPLSFGSYPLLAPFFNCCFSASTLTTLHPSFLSNQIDILVFTFKSLDRFSISSLTIIFQTALACQLPHPVSQGCPFPSFPEHSFHHTWFAGLHAVLHAGGSGWPCWHHWSIVSEIICPSPASTPPFLISLYFDNKLFGAETFYSMLGSCFHLPNISKY